MRAAHFFDSFFLIKEQKTFEENGKKLFAGTNLMKFIYTYK
jgi:hypothetical protein